MDTVGEGEDGTSGGHICYDPEVYFTVQALSVFHLDYCSSIVSSEVGIFDSDKLFSLKHFCSAAKLMPLLY